MKKWIQAALCVLLILALLCPMTQAMALAYDDRKAIYQEALETLSQGKWVEPDYEEYYYVVCENGKIVKHSGPDYATEYFLTVSYTGAVLLTCYGSDGEYSVYEVSFSYGGDETWMLWSFTQYQGQVRGFLYRLVQE